EAAVSFFALVMDTLVGAGYEHYEISNFCRPGKHSQHNSAYWEGGAYMGCGASAHSYNGTSREWNVSSLTSYIASMKADKRKYETEVLDTDTRYNELVIISIRTRRGLPLQKLKAAFGEEYLTYCLRMAQKYIESGKLERNADCLRLTREGLFISDGIMSDLFRVNR
ncbi:Oxygen-independent coproporphyrinogen-III oxidase-like protein, partial [termite gut metagenome]